MAAVREPTGETAPIPFPQEKSTPAGCSAAKWLSTRLRSGYRAMDSRAALQVVVRP